MPTRTAPATATAPAAPAVELPDDAAGVLAAARAETAVADRSVPVDAFTAHVSKDIVQILQGLVILFVAAEAMFRGPLGRVRLAGKAPQ